MKRRLGSQSQATPAIGRKSILLVDDHPAVREGVAVAINQTDDLVVCGHAASSSAAMAEIARLKPDAVLADISLANSNGVELIKDIRSRYSGKMPVLVLSMHDELLYAERVLRAGARGYLMKNQPMKTVITALRKVLDGGVYLSEEMTTRVMGSFAKCGAPPTRSSIESLSDRELEVFDLVSQGHATREIAALLHLSKKTVSCYQQSIRKKLNLKNATELVRHAVHWAATTTASERQR
ncbi:MAG TPA: response regulator transcription factor [Verrucomicrobiae bacterium]|nr:response regulator transcription factor [Verrucomicrobiae bacterium]